MSKNARTTSRRRFLELAAAGTAGAAFAAAGSNQVFAQTERRDGYKVFSEGQIAGMRLKNRLVRSATWEAAASKGEVTDTYIGLHKALAEGGVGMIISGYVAPVKLEAAPQQIHVYDNRYIAGLRKVADAVHAADGECKLFAQIGHGGGTVGPSGIRWPSKRKGKSLSTEEVDEMGTSFAEAVGRVKEAGWDGVELHGAHAYLLCSFLSPYTNKRTDKYGGSTENRVRIIRDIVAQARQLVGTDFPIIIKVNSDDGVKGGIDAESFPELANEVEKVGVDAIDVSGSNCIQAGIDSPEKESYFLKAAESIDVNVPVILTGGNRSIGRLEKTLQNSDKVGFFGIARPLIREPGLPKRWLEGEGDDVAKCIHCNGCFGTIVRGGPVHCIQEA
jgi:2,4-dienoyl-CoA reductase-like NADH-dependent reductase (Old Yellow Enzyme family)